MLTIGVAAHKRIHMAVAVDAAGHEVSQWRGANSVAGWRAGADWAAALGGDVRWGIAGAWNDGRGLARQLVAAGATVSAVNPRWTAEGRRRARRTDKRSGTTRTGNAWLKTALVQAAHGAARAARYRRIAARRGANAPAWRWPTGS